MKIKLAERLNVIQPSPTLAITTLANQLKADGKDIVGFGAGEPDFDTPNHIKEAAKKALDDGITKYSPVTGYPALRKVICEKLAKDNNFNFEPNEVIVSTGGKQVLFNLFMALLNKGDEVIIPTPYWVSYAEMVKLGEGVPVFVEASFEEEFKVSAKSIEEKINPHTKAIIMNFPSNPTGAMLEKDELQKIASLLKEHPEIVIITDDIYEKLIFDEQKFYNLQMLEPELLPQSVIVNGMSKAYSMTGWRLGYAATKIEGLIKAMSKLQGQSTSGPTSFSQMGGLTALSAEQSAVEEMKVAFVERRNYIYEALNKCVGLRAHKPGGAFYIFPDFSELSERDGFKKAKKEHGKEGDSDSQFFCSYLLQQKLVACVPGIAFGYDKGFRVGYATSMEQIKKGVERIGQFCDELYQ